MKKIQVLGNFVTLEEIRGFEEIVVMTGVIVEELLNNM